MPSNLSGVVVGNGKSAVEIEGEINLLAPQPMLDLRATAGPAILVYQGAVCGQPMDADAIATRLTELLFARDALRIAIATERSGLEFYSRAARVTKDARGRRIFDKLAEEQAKLAKFSAIALGSRARATRVATSTGGR